MSNPHIGNATPTATAIRALGSLKFKIIYCQVVLEALLPIKT
ncbi:hypothetical protein Pf1_02476 [Flavobacterium columnare]|nr:hypothetical protein Pf1_02476 [Flavobacterium columnare]